MTTSRLKRCPRGALLTLSTGAICLFGVGATAPALAKKRAAASQRKIPGGATQKISATSGTNSVTLIVCRLCS